MFYVSTLKKWSSQLYVNYVYSDMKLFTKLYLFNNNVYLPVLSFRKYFNLPHSDIWNELFVVRSRISKIDFQGHHTAISLYKILKTRKTNMNIKCRTSVLRIISIFFYFVINLSSWILYIAACIVIGENMLACSEHLISFPVLWGFWLIVPARALCFVFVILLDLSLHCSCLYPDSLITSIQQLRNVFTNSVPTHVW